MNMLCLGFIWNKIKEKICKIENYTKIVDFFINKLNKFTKKSQNTTHIRNYVETKIKI